jgi:phage-related protein
VKPIEFIGTSLDSLRSFPKGVRQQLGFQLDRV